MITAAIQIIAAYKSKRRNRKGKGKKKKKKIKIGKISLSKRGSTPRFNDFFAFTYFRNILCYDHISIYLLMKKNCQFLKPKKSPA